MKVIIFLIFTTILSSSLCLANDLRIPQKNLHLPQQSWNFMPTAEYGFVPTREDRLNMPNDFIRFPGWQDMEIVRREEINQNLANQVNTDLWNEVVSIDSMRDLVLQAFDIWTVDIRRLCGYSIIPFATDIRYRMAGWWNALHQGTINSFGAIRVIVDNEEVVRDIKILRFDDSQTAERHGRKMGTIDQYDIHFIEGIVFPLLKNYLSTEENKEKLLGFLEGIPKGVCY